VYEIRGYDVQTADVENVHVVGEARSDEDELEGFCIKIVGQKAKNSSFSHCQLFVSTE
jgi:hypothetical protein